MLTACHNGKKNFPWLKFMKEQRHMEAGVLPVNFVVGDQISENSSYYLFSDDGVMHGSGSFAAHELISGQLEVQD